MCLSAPTSVRTGRQVRYPGQLLDAVGKTSAAHSVEPTIDFEKHIIVGDAAFMKKVFKVIGQLDSKAGAAGLASRYDAAAETRPNMLGPYEATLARLARRMAWARQAARSLRFLLPALLGCLRPARS